ncbi:MAG: hypothetical protein MN733_24345 [Nitrososphaera sp.]|nr:hypothetical protein [Nitrososphaera sp.]
MADGSQEKVCRYFPNSVAGRGWKFVVADMSVQLDPLPDNQTAFCPWLRLAVPTGRLKANTTTPSKAEAVISHSSCKK